MSVLRSGAKWSHRVGVTSVFTGRTIQGKEGKVCPAADGLVRKRDLRLSLEEMTLMTLSAPGHYMILWVESG